MTITAKIIADSISPHGDRLTTMQLRYPRFIHPEFLTHRVFSRNASSSRAVPVEKLIEDVLRDPATPSHWGKNQSGMQAHEELDKTSRARAMDEWDLARFDAVHTARRLAGIGAHKQIVNRILEPFSHINVLVTATEWSNFDALRRHPDAQPEIKILADAMHEAQAASRPSERILGDWHLPYVTPEDCRDILKMRGHGDWSADAFNDLIKLSVARCARVSYLTHEGAKPDIVKDLALYQRLVGSAPLHASPAEHQATPDAQIERRDWRGLYTKVWGNPGLHGNFTGWMQYRKMLPNESQ